MHSTKIGTPPRIWGIPAVVSMALSVVLVMAWTSSAFGAAAFGSVNTGVNSSSWPYANTLVISAPASIAAGDLLLAGFTVDGNPSVVSPPADWTPILRNGGSGLGTHTYYKVATASEPASYTWTFGESRRAAGGIIRYTGVDTSNPIVTSAGGTAGSSSEVIAPTVTTTADDTLIVSFFGINDNRTFSPPTGMTERFDVRNTNSDGPAISAADQVIVTAGATGTRTATLSSSSWSSARASQTIALRTAPSNNAPGSPTSLGQFESDATTAIAIGATTNETSVVFKGTATDTDGDTWKLEVEVKATNAAFDGTGTIISSGFVASAGENTVTATGLTSMTDYHWRARAVDSNGGTSAWVSFGGNSDGAPPGTLADTDFRVDTTPPPLSATITVSKSYSNSTVTPVTVKLSCDGSGSIDDGEQTATPDGTNAVFTITGFTAGDECTVEEDPIPAGYSVTYGVTGDDCDSEGVVALTAGGAFNCTITNTRDTGTIELKKVWETSSDTVTLKIGTTAGGTDIAEESSALTTGEKTVPTGTYYLSETMDTSVYVGTLSCKDGGGNTVQTGTNNSVAVGKGAIIVCTFTNFEKGAGVVFVGQGSCLFDKNPDVSGRQFRLLFTPDQKNPEYKVTSTNPGQFFLYILTEVNGEDTITVDVPEPFVTKGATPTHIYDDAAFNEETGCLEGVGAGIGSSKNQVTDGVLSIPVEGSGLVFIKVHLDYGLKGVGGYSVDANNNATKTSSPINNFTPYTFTITGAGLNETDTIQNENVFKKLTGIGGLILDDQGDGIPNLAVAITGAEGKKIVESSGVQTDDDGWYVYIFKYTGKQATFTITPTNIEAKTTVVRSNSFNLVNFGE
jgi:hypothetical protein